MINFTIRRHLTELADLPDATVTTGDRYTFPQECSDYLFKIVGEFQSH